MLFISYDLYCLICFPTFLEKFLCYNWMAPNVYCHCVYLSIWKNSYCVFLVPLARNRWNFRLHSVSWVFFLKVSNLSITNLWQNILIQHFNLKQSPFFTIRPKICNLGRKYWEALNVVATHTKNGSWNELLLRNLFTWLCSIDMKTHKI